MKKQKVFFRNPLLFFGILYLIISNGIISQKNIKEYMEQKDINNNKDNL